MSFTSLLLFCFAAAVICLGGGLVFMVRGQGGRRLTRALMWRVFFCALLLLVVLVGLYSGGIQYQAPWLR